MAVIVAHGAGVLQAESDDVADEFVVAAVDELVDGVLGLECDEGLVAVGVSDAVHLGDGPTELFDHLGQLLGLGQLAPVEVGLIRRQLRDDEPRPVDLCVAQQGIGVGLQRALRHRGPVPVVFEVVADFLVVEGGIHLYDSLAVAVAIRPELVRTEPAWVEVETRGRSTYGQTVAYLSPLHKLWTNDRANCEVCLELVDGPGFSRLFAERVLAPLRDGAAPDATRNT